MSLHHAADRAGGLHLPLGPWILRQPVLYPSGSASRRAVPCPSLTTYPSPTTCLHIPAGAPASRRRRSSSEERQPRQPPAEISLLLERSRRGAGGQGVALESLQVLTSDSIRDVQLRLRNLTAWFRPEQHALVRQCAGHLRCRPGGFTPFSCCL